MLTASGNIKSCRKSSLMADNVKKEQQIHDRGRSYIWNQA